MGVWNKRGGNAQDRLCLALQYGPLVRSGQAYLGLLLLLCAAGGQVCSHLYQQ